MDYEIACKMADVSPYSSRQHRKFDHKRGAAYRVSIGLPKTDLFESTKKSKKKKTSRKKK